MLRSRPVAEASGVSAEACGWLTSGWDEEASVSGAGPAVAVVEGALDCEAGWLAGESLADPLHPTTVAAVIAKTARSVNIRFI